MIPPEVAARLGTISDAELARQTGLKPTVIRKARLAANIDPYRVPKAPHKPRQPLDVDGARKVIRRLAAGLELLDGDGVRLHEGAFAAISRYADSQGLKYSRAAVCYAWERGIARLDRWPLAGLPTPPPQK